MLQNAEMHEHKMQLLMLLALMLLALMLLALMLLALMQCSHFPCRSMAMCAVIWEDRHKGIVMNPATCRAETFDALEEGHSISGEIPDEHKVVMDVDGKPARSTNFNKVEAVHDRSSDVKVLTSQ